MPAYNKIQSSLKLDQNLTMQKYIYIYGATLLFSLKLIPPKCVDDDPSMKLQNIRATHLYMQIKLTMNENMHTSVQKRTQSRTNMCAMVKDI